MHYRLPGHTAMGAAILLLLLATPGAKGRQVRERRAVRRQVEINHYFAYGHLEGQIDMWQKHKISATHVKYSGSNQRAATL